MEVSLTQNLNHNQFIIDSNQQTGLYDLLAKDAESGYWISLEDAFEIRRYGCTDSLMYNFDSLSTHDDSSCVPFVYGCTDSTMFNYNLLANSDDGTCIPYIYGCTDSVMFNYNILANTDDSSCIPIVIGCVDSSAYNYNVNANTSDSSLCCYLSGCTNPLACNYDSLAQCDDGTCNLNFGCTNPLACNYDSSAQCDDGSCFTISGCTDLFASNYNELACFDDSSCIYAVEILPNSTGRANSLQVFISSDDSSSFKVGTQPALLTLVHDSTGESIDLANNYTSWTFDSASNSEGFYSYLKVDSSYFNQTEADSLSQVIPSFDTLTNFSSGIYHTISATTNNITDATSIIFTFRARDMYSSDLWQIFDEAGNYLMQYYTPKHAYLYDCGEYSFAYEASASQMSYWTSDGTLSFLVTPIGFSSNYGSCSGGDYITASLGQSDKLTYWSKQ